MRIAIQISLILYHLLLLFYPREFRREYGTAMVQTFRDCLNRASKEAGFLGLLRLWLRILADLAKSYVVEHKRNFEEKHQISFKKFLGLVAVYLLAIALGLFIGYNDIRNTDVQPAVASLLAVTAIFGFAQPKRAWLWALLVGGGVPMAHLIGLMVNYKPPYKTYLIETFIALIPAFLGVYAGVAGRKIVFSSQG